LITESDASSSTKTSFDLLDDFFLPIQWRGSKVGNTKFDRNSDGGGETLEVRVSKGQTLKGKDRVRKKKKKEGP
jgi:hypothetical protein